MTPEEAAEIVRRFLERMPKENAEWWLEEMGEMEEFLRRNRWLYRWRRFQAIWKLASRWVLLLLILIAILMMIRCSNELSMDVAPPIPSGIACSSDGVDKIYRFVQVSTWQGCRTSMDKAFREAESMCASMQGSCTGGSTCSPGVCATGVHVKDVNQNPGWISCDTYVGFSCDCGCR